ncbi:MAG: single-stranded-DNA-specific exonuclease RecJ [Pelagibacteraceae bacterium TMED216]|nr:MAG: single-stranded-DNA-specific exonuclease RecJ [Pelagibacteraceae bacterium TMED216]
MNSVSLTGKKWILKDFDYNYLKFIKENYYLDEITSKLLAIRKIDKNQIKLFMNPSIKNMLPNPNILKDMDKAVMKSYDTILKKSKVAIFGDYDVDGASSTAMLGNYFKLINHPYEIYIPDRKTEGYGPNLKTFEKFIKNNVKLIFTVDCGTVSYDPINFANVNKTDVIVLDHHQSDVTLPKAYSIVNPNRLDDKSQLNYLCAAGVTFLFLVALNKRLREKNWFLENNIVEPNLLNFLDLVSIGTVCDVVPLIGLNRALVKQGLEIIKLRKNLGLKTLIDICEIRSTPTTYHLGYVLGPRINAGGRVGKCSHGANLLLNINSSEVYKIATDLNMYNSQRKNLEKKLLNEIINNKIINKNEPAIILEGKNWHEGVIGIVASRIKDMYNKPVIIITTEKKIGKGSARSIVGFDIGSVILSAVHKKILLKGGGHKMAGGFSLDISKLESFKEFVFTKIKLFKNINLIEKKLYIDSQISPSALNIDFFNKVNILSPFGSGNPEPKFIIEDMKVIKSFIVGENHVKSILESKDGSNLKTIAFNVTNNQIGQYLLNKNNKFLNLVGKLSLNDWKGEKNVEFIIDDISVNKTIKNTVPSSIG